MNFSELTYNISKFWFASLLALVGIIVLVYPFTTGDAAYYHDGMYLGMKSDFPAKYEEHCESLVASSKSDTIIKLISKERRKIEQKFAVYADSLKIYSATKNKEALKRVSKELNATEDYIEEFEQKVVERFSFENLPPQERLEIKKAVMDTFSLQKYIELVVSNNLDDGSQDYEKIRFAELDEKEINQQSFTPFVIFGLSLLIVSVLIILISLQKLNIAAAVQFGAAAFVVFVLVYLGSSMTIVEFKEPLEFEKQYKERSAVVKNHLEMLRDIQGLFLEDKGRYCNRFDELKQFIKEDSLQRIKYYVSPDDSVKIREFIIEGKKIADTLNIAVIDELIENIKFDKSKITTLDIVPFSNDVPFRIDSKFIKKKKTRIPVFEISTREYWFLNDIVPENFDETSVLKIGSLTEATINGNWGD